METWKAIKESYLSNRTMKRLLVLIGACLSLLLSACQKTDVMTVKELESFINDHLSPGDSAETIEAFLKEQEWPYNYNQFAKRYSTRNPKIDVEKTLFTTKGIAIWLYVDESKAFLRAEVEEVYTRL